MGPEILQILDILRWCKRPLSGDHTLGSKAAGVMIRFSAASVLDLSSSKIHKVRGGQLWLSSWRGQSVWYHLLNILLCAGHNAKDFTSIITCNPQYNPLSSYWYPHFTDKETEFRRLLQIHMVLSDFKAHALNHNANFLHNESVSLTPRASLNGTVEGEGVFEQILMSWCGHHKPNTKVLRNILKHMLVSL